MNCDLIQRLTFAKEAAKYFSNSIFSVISSHSRSQFAEWERERKKYECFGFNRASKFITQFSKIFSVLAFFTRSLYFPCIIQIIKLYSGSRKQLVWRINWMWILSAFWKFGISSGDDKWMPQYDRLKNQ